MSSQRSSRWGLSRHVSLLVCASFFLTPAAHVARAQQQAQDEQDVAKAARLERARKAAQKKAAHVYTNDELKKDEILTDEDRARVEARKHDPNDPNKPAMPTFDASVSPAPESLGEIARRIRKEVAARQAEEAAKTLSPLFPMQIEQPVFAIPVEPGEPVAPMKSLPWKNPRPMAKASHVAPVTPAAAVRRDPFAQQGSLTSDEMAPARPNVSLTNVAPHAPVAHRGNDNAAPNLHLVAPSTVAPSAVAHPAPSAPAAPAKERHLSVTTGSASAVRHTRAASAPKLTLPTLGTAPSLGTLDVPDAPAAVAIIAPATERHIHANSMPVAHATSGVTLSVSPAVIVPKTPSAPALAAPEVPSAPAAPFVGGISVPAMPAYHASAGIAAPDIALPVAPAAPALALDPAPIAPAAAVAPLAPRTAPLTPMNSANTLIVRSGDSLWKLARRIFGNGNRWNELAARNPAITNPNHIVPGTVLAVPAGDAPSHEDSSNRVPVQSGDSLWKLAAFYLGRGSAWNCIAEANPQVKNADKIYPGQSLAMPESCPGETEQK